MLALLAFTSVAPAQTSGSDKDETLDIFAEHPRLFLRAQRLKLLRRENERRSQRWQQFETLVAGKAPMPELGFALALYYQASEDAAIGKQAVQWALSPKSNDLR
ncbi:MAG: hypothetical protein ABIZ80_23105, partial [Bryobacteraceae bacterium]